MGTIQCQLTVALNKHLTVLRISSISIPNIDTCSTYQLILFRKYIAITKIYCNHFELCFFIMTLTLSYIVTINYLHDSYLHILDTYKTSCIINTQCNVIRDHIN